MELTLMLFGGALAGALAGALNGLIGSIIRDRAGSIGTDPAQNFSGIANELAVRARATTLAWRSPSAFLQLLNLSLHLATGLALSFLFWLSWGLTAIISVTWWVRGLSFAGLTWLALCFPLLAMQMLSAHLPARFVLRAARESLIVCVVVGLACAWNWAKGP